MAHSLMVTKSAGGCGAARLGGPYEALRRRTDQGGSRPRGWKLKREGSTDPRRELPMIAEQLRRAHGVRCLRNVLEPRWLPELRR